MMVIFAEYLFYGIVRLKDLYKKKVKNKRMFLKSKFCSGVLVGLLAMNIIFDAILGSELWVCRYPFLAGSLVVAIAAQGMALSRLCQKILHA